MRYTKHHKTIEYIGMHKHKKFEDVEIQNNMNLLNM